MKQSLVIKVLDNITDMKKEINTKKIFFLLLLLEAPKKDIYKIK